MRISERALAACREREQEQSRERERRAAQRREEERLKDEETMGWVQEHRVSRWFPDAHWKLVDRRFPQSTAVIQPVDEPNILLIVTKGDEDVLLADPAEAKKQQPKWLVSAIRCRSIADLGYALHGGAGR